MNIDMSSFHLPNSSLKQLHELPTFKTIITAPFLLYGRNIFLNTNYAPSDVFARFSIFIFHGKTRYPLNHMLINNIFAYNHANRRDPYV